MTTISAKIIADSINGVGNRLTTIHMRYPRFIHAELMTHRVFSRNARSSRAVPVKTMIDEIVNDPVVPLHWGKNQKGMQAEHEHDGKVIIYARPPSGVTLECDNVTAWLLARDNAIMLAEAFDAAGYHKQVVNRLLEPFMHIDVLVSATEWANFLWLRDHKDAEPHIAMLAREVRQVMDASTPERMHPGDWHLPYVRGRDDIDDINLAIKISAARCARISYKPFDGGSNYAAEVERYDRLVGSQPMHASPVEHQATPDPSMSYPQQHGNFVGWRQFRKTLSGENHDGR